MVGKKKKIIILASMVALLVLTGVLNVVLNVTATKPEEVSGEGTYVDFFTAYKVDRESSREQSVMYYNEILTSSTYSAEAKQEAEKMLLSLTASIEIELVLEGQIKSLGFDDAIVTSTTQNINVIVKCAEMTATQANQILEIIIAETGTSATSVRIFPTE